MTVQDVISYFQERLDGITLADGSGFMTGMQDVGQKLTLAIKEMKRGDYMMAKNLLGHSPWHYF